MKKTIICLMLLFGVAVCLSVPLYAQDLIVTNEGDSINCKITRIKGGYVHFTFIHREEIRNTLLPMDQVNYHQYNYYGEPFAQHGIQRNLGQFKKFRAALNFGWSSMTAKISENIPSYMTQYVKQLKSGYHYGFDMSYYFAEQMGVGIKFAGFKTKNQMYTPQGLMSDNINISFIGPTLNSRLLNIDKKNSFLLNLGLGYMGYKDNAFLNSNLRLTSGTFGMSYDLGYDIGVSEKVAIGFQLSMLSGILRKIDVYNGIYTTTVQLEKDEYENLSRIDLSVGLRFY